MRLSIASGRTATAPVKAAVVTVRAGSLRIRQQEGSLKDPAKLRMSRGNAAGHEPELGNRPSQQDINLQDPAEDVNEESRSARTRSLETVSAEQQRNVRQRNQERLQNF